MKGRSKKKADRHYQKLADAEVKRLRDSVPDTAPVIAAEGTR